MEKEPLRGPRGSSRLSTRTNMAYNDPTYHEAFVALGSNMGSRIEMIEKACLEMEKAGIKVEQTSSLFETAPMYVLDQDPFINGVCKIKTSLKPFELLDMLQSIEKRLGRKKLVEKGPRSIDLDILLYGHDVVSSERLNIPHKLMLERDFVLRPLCQLIPNQKPALGDQSLTYRDYLKALSQDNPIPDAVTPLSSSCPPLRFTDPKRRTHIMAILNLTPDSFSDGGRHSPNDLSTLASTVRAFIAAGATVIDIGGQSSRPGSASVSESEELARVIPAIRYIRSSIPEAANIAISIDTYRARVAEEACAAGADIINDISAGTLDADMLRTMARTGKTVILMHMRGTPSTMNDQTHYPDGVLRGVSIALRERVAAAERAGIRRWRMILDPGIGFAKDTDQNLTLLRRFEDLRRSEGIENFPWLVGPSRKKFVGKITGIEKPEARILGTSVALTASIAGGADIIRVHDVGEASEVTKMADAIYRA